MGFKSRIVRTGIRVVKNTDRRVVARCFSCNRKTVYWYTPKDMACCQICAEQLTSKDIPSKKISLGIKPCGKTMAHWENESKRNVIEALVRAASQMDSLTIHGPMTRGRLLELAKMEDSDMYKEVLSERNACISEFAHSIVDLFGVSSITRSTGN